MALTLWGILEKSQTDNETIEQAIARMIQDHEDDSNAHLETGESLESHKASEIIDHLISSVVADKLSDKQKLYSLNFESLDSFWTYTSGGSITINCPGVNLQTGNVTNNYSRVNSFPVGPELLDFTLSPFFQAIVYQNSISNVDSNWYWGHDEGDDTSLAIGFRTTGGNLQAVVLIGNTLRTANIAGITITDINIYRAMVNASEKKVYFYVNGVLKTTITYTETATKSDYGVGFKVKTLENSNKSILVRQVILAHD